MSARELHVDDSSLYQRSSSAREAAREIRALWRYRNLFRHLAQSSLASETAGTAFGSVWWLLDPLILVGVYYFFVETILRSGGEDYALFIFIGITAWKHLASSVTSSISSTLRREQLMRQVAFPKSVIPLATVAAGTIHFLIALVIFLAISIPLGVYPDIVLPMILIPVAIQVALVLGLSYLLSALNIFFRDVQNMTGYVFRLFFFLSPILYTIAFIPEDWRTLYQLNPFATIIPAYHSILLDGQLPAAGPLALVGALSVLTLGVGFLTFVRLQQTFTKVS